MFINSDILRGMIDLVAKCPKCTSCVEFRHNVDKKMGFAQHVSLTCGKCKWSYETFTSKQFKTPESDTRGAKSFDINYRSIIAFREIGRGHR